MNMSQSRERNVSTDQHLCKMMHTYTHPSPNILAHINTQPPITSQPHIHYMHTPSPHPHTPHTAHTPQSSHIHSHTLFPPSHPPLPSHPDTYLHTPLPHPSHIHATPLPTPHIFMHTYMHTYMHTPLPLPPSPPPPPSLTHMYMPHIASTLSSLSTAEQMALNFSCGTPQAANIPSKIFLWFTCTQHMHSKFIQTCTVYVYIQR